MKVINLQLNLHMLIYNYMSTQQLSKWAKIINCDVNDLSIHEKYQAVMEHTDDVIVDMSAWIIRKCDREDYRDWMPYRERSPGHQIRVYYVNVNKLSRVHAHSLVLAINGPRVIIDEWDGSRIVSSVPAVIENVPAADKPDDETSIQIAGYIALNGGSRGNAPTINGESIGQKRR